MKIYPKMNDREFEVAILKIYEDDQNECNAKFGGTPMHYTMEAERCQKQFWKLHRINRPKFLVAFAAFYEARPKPLLPNDLQCVEVYGGPSSHFHVANWVEIHGRHYLQIRISLSEYRRMRQQQIRSDTYGEREGQV